VALLSNLVWGGLGRPIQIEESKRTRHDDQDSIDEEDHIKALEAKLGHLGLCERRNSHASCHKGHKILCPKVLIIGTNHGGSTTISDVLRHHRSMSYGKMKEHRFFFQGSARCLLGLKTKCPSTDSLNGYIQSFKVPCDTEVTFDGSPQTHWIGNPSLAKNDKYFPGVEPGVEGVRYVREVLGSDLRIIMTIRDPVDWLSSMFNSNRVPVPLPPTFSTLMKNVTCWADSLDAWLRTFPSKQFLFICSEELFENEAAVLQDISDFIGMPMNGKDVSTSSGRRRNKSPIPMSVRQRYHDSPEGRRCTEALYNLIGRRCRWKYSPGS